MTEKRLVLFLVHATVSVLRDGKIESATQSIHCPASQVEKAEGFIKKEIAERSRAFGLEVQKITCDTEQVSIPGYEIIVKKL